MFTRLLLLLLLFRPAFAQYPFTNGIKPSITTVGGLPTAAAGNKGVIFTVSDGASTSDCTSGSGSTQVTCISNGSAWTALGGGSQWTTSGSNISYNAGNVSIGTTVPGGAPASSLAVLGNIYGASGLFTPVVNSFASQISGGSITGSSTSGFGVSVTGTLNTTGVVDGAVLFSNITNTASNPQSTLIDLQSGGVSYLAFSLGNNGRLSVGNTALQVGELLLGSTGAANSFANALGVLTAQNGYLLIKSEPAGSSGLNEPGIQLLASNGTDVGSIIAAYGSGFGGGNTTANSAFYLLNTTSNSNTNYDVMDTRLTPSLNVTGCTGATLATDSSNWTGSITGLPTGACTIVLTFAVSSGQGSGVAHHAWTCAVSDNTTANLFRVSASSTSSVTFSGVSASGDVLSYGPCGGY